VRHNFQTWRKLPFLGLYLKANTEHVAMAMRCGQFVQNKYLQYKKQLPEWNLLTFSHTIAANANTPIQDSIAEPVSLWPFGKSGLKSKT